MARGKERVALCLLMLVDGLQAFFLFVNSIQVVLDVHKIRHHHHKVFYGLEGIALQSRDTLRRVTLQLVT